MISLEKLKLENYVCTFAISSAFISYASRSDRNGSVTFNTKTSSVNFVILFTIEYSDRFSPMLLYLTLIISSSLFSCKKNWVHQRYVYLILFPSHVSPVFTESMNQKENVTLFPRGGEGIVYTRNVAGTFIQKTRANIRAPTIQDGSHAW